MTALATASGVRPRPAALPPLAWRSVGVVAVLAAAVFLARAGRYDYWGDELYFIAIGARPAVNYVDQGALVPLLAHWAHLAAPGSLPALRLPAIAMTVLAAVLTALLARECGGGRGAQTLAAVGFVTSPFAVTQAAVLSTFTFDAALVTAVVWLVVRWIRCHRDGLLVAAGLVAALDVQVKWLIPAVWAALGLGVLCCGPRVLLRAKGFWIGTAVAALAAAPGLCWQAEHGWPQAAMGPAIRAEERAAGGGLLGSLWECLQLTGILGSVLLLAGGRLLWRSPALRPYRFLLPATAVLAVLIVAGGLRTYYLADMFPACYGAGAVGLARAARTVPRRAAVTGLGALSLALAVTLVFALPERTRPEPIATQSQFSARVRFFGPEGWRELTAATVSAYHSLPAADRAHVVIVTQTYWQAAALEVLGADRLPPVYSPNRGYWYYGPPPASAATVLYVGVADAVPRLRANYADVRALRTVDHPLGLPGVDRGVTVWRCARPRAPWSARWPARPAMPLDDGI